MVIFFGTVRVVVKSQGILPGFIHFGLQKRNGLWSPDLQSAVMPEHIEDLTKVVFGSTLTANVSLFTHEVPTNQLQNDLQRRIELLLTLTGAAHSICICQTSDPERERCFQFASGLSLVFVHQNGLESPYSGFLHEVIHGFGLTGIPEIDEGIAMLFDEAASAGALSFMPEITLNIEWCRNLASRQVSPANVYTFGSSYFAAIVEEKGIDALWRERERLGRMASVEAIREHMRRYLIGVRSRSYLLPEGPVSVETLNQLYFNGDLASFSAGGIKLFSESDPNQLSASEQLTFARLVIYQATLETEEISGTLKPLLQSSSDAVLGEPFNNLMEIARTIFAARQSQSRIALKKNSKKLNSLLIDAYEISEIRADILLLLVQFHKYVPEIAGGDRAKASDYAAELARLPGMGQVGQQMHDALQKQAIA